MRFETPVKGICFWTGLTPPCAGPRSDRRDLRYATTGMDLQDIFGLSPQLNRSQRNLTGQAEHTGITEIVIEPRRRPSTIYRSYGVKLMIKMGEIKK